MPDSRGRASMRATSVGFWPAQISSAVLKQGTAAASQMSLASSSSSEKTEAIMKRNPAQATISRSSRDIDGGGAKTMAAPSSNSHARVGSR